LLYYFTEQKKSEKGWLTLCVKHSRQLPKIITPSNLVF
jgi:hypothetical protein